MFVHVGVMEQLMWVDLQQSIQKKKRFGNLMVHFAVRGYIKTYSTIFSQSISDHSVVVLKGKSSFGPFINVPSSFNPRIPGSNSGLADKRKLIEAGILA